MTKLIFATGNKGKLREAAEILGSGFELISSAEAGCAEDVPETGDTLKANSLIKAQHIWKRLGQSCFADDTGLEVDLLGGAPGVRTARYAGGDGHDFEANMDKLLREMAGGGTRTARFHSVVTLIMDGRTHFFEGTLEGRIACSKAGCGGFGYDPVFIPDLIPGPDGRITGNSAGLTLAEIPEEAKNAISHRGKALRAMAEFLRG